MTTAVTGARRRSGRLSPARFRSNCPSGSDHDASIGAAAIPLPGVTVGHHAVVGAGAVVTGTSSREPWSPVTPLVPSAD